MSTLMSDWTYSLSPITDTDPVNIKLKWMLISIRVKLARIYGTAAALIIVYYKFSSVNACG